MYLQTIGASLKENKTLKSLNLESNYISGEAITDLLEALVENNTLTQLRLVNQVDIYCNNLNTTVQHECAWLKAPANC